jgi:hypothetical protein
LGDDGWKEDAAGRGDLGQWRGGRR